MFINQNSFIVFALMALVGASWWAYQGAWAPVRIAVLGDIDAVGVGQNVTVSDHFCRAEDDPGAASAAAVAEIDRDLHHGLVEFE